MNILVTGANGFVGLSLCQEIVSKEWSVWGTVRSLSQANALPSKVQSILIDSLVNAKLLENVLSEIDCVVHLAARVHQMNDIAVDPLEAFREVNTHATANLARLATAKGVKRFVYISSIKVNGEGNNFSTKQTDNSSNVYTEEDLPTPQDPYGISKLEAEQSLHQIASETGLEVVILRPPLIYGPKVKANFLQLLRLVKLGIPLPFGSIKNARSLLYIGNFVNAISTCIDHPKAAGQTFLISDGEDVSTPELIRRIAKALGQRDRLFSMQYSWLESIGRLTRKSSTIERLTGSLRVNSRKIQQTLNWKPPFTLEQGLQATADWYLSR